MKFLVPLAMLVWSGFLVAFGLQTWAEREIRIAGMVETEALVTLAETRKSRPTSRASFAWAEVRFTDRSGAQMEAGYNYGLSLFGPREGDVVSIYYDPDQPKDIEGAEFWTMWGGYIVGALVAVLSGWMALSMLIPQIRALFGRANA